MAEFIWSRREAQTVDALAVRGDEGRGILRKASGSWKQAIIRRCPNGGTRHLGVICNLKWLWKRTWGTETSQYPKEKKSKEIP